jgi:hypothetical protein
MRAIWRNIFCIFIFVLVIYLIQQLTQSKEDKPFPMQKQNNLNANAMANQNAFLNADALTNANANRSQHELALVDRLPLVVEDTVIRPANEIAQMNYKDCNSVVYKDAVEKELYTTDLPLFKEKGPVHLVPLDINDSQHRRVNFY